MPAIEDTVVNVEILKNILVTRATGGQPEEADYFRVRQALLKDPMARGRLPRFVRSCRTIPEFWSFIQPKFPSYAERRQFIADEFDALLTKRRRQRETLRSMPVPKFLRPWIRCMSRKPGIRQWIAA